jgi:hypothetical protein
MVDLLMRAHMSLVRSVVAAQNAHFKDGMLVFW